MLFYSIYKIVRRVCFIEKREITKKCLRKIVAIYLIITEVKNTQNTRFTNIL